MRSPSRSRLSRSAGVLAAALVATACSSGSGDRTASTKPARSAISATEAATRQSALRTDMRKLWEDHITWTRLYIISAKAGSSDTDTITARLLQNQVDIGDAIKPLYETPPAHSSRGSCVTTSSPPRT